MKDTKFADNKVWTPIYRFKKNKLEITAIGMIHFGEEEYYQNVQKIMDNLEFGFFEGVGRIKDIESIPEDKLKLAENLSKLKETYTNLASHMGLVMQNLKYDDNWKNSDVSLENLLMKLPDNFRLPVFAPTSVMKNAYEASPKEFKKAFKGISFFIYKNQNFFHRTSKEVKEILVNYRNEILFEDLETKFKENPSGEMGLVYGAGHLPGIKTYLLENGFETKEKGWLPAWISEERVNFWNFLKNVSSFLRLTRPYAIEEVEKKKKLSKKQLKKQVRIKIKELEREIKEFDGLFSNE